MDRPWFVRDLVLFDVAFPFSPITVIIFAVSALILYRGFTKESSAVASHILLDDTSDETGKKLNAMKKEIGNSLEKFSEYAQKHSKCPSGKTKDGRYGYGCLGKFNRGNMVPSFDRVVFSPKSGVGEVLGPVQTSFGWHLIWIHSRDEQRQLVAE